MSSPIKMMEDIIATDLALVRRARETGREPAPQFIACIDRERVNLNRLWSPYLAGRRPFNGAAFDPRCYHCHKRRSTGHAYDCTHPDAIERRRRAGR